MIETKNMPAINRRARHFLKGIYSKMLCNPGKKASPPLFCINPKPLETILVSVISLIMVCGIFVNTGAETDLVTTLLCITLLLMAINLFSINVVIAITLLCMMTMTATFLYEGGYQHREAVTELIRSLTTLAAITFLALRSKCASDTLRHHECYLIGAQRMSRTGSVGFHGDREEMSWSEESARIFEYPPSKKPTVSMFIERTHPDDRALVKALFDKAARHEVLIETKPRLVMPDGRIKHVHMTASPLLGECGRFGYIGALTDVTASKLAEEELFRAHTQLAHINRVTSLGELAASLAHEVNQPLTAISSGAAACSNWLSRPVPDLDEARKSLDRVIISSGRANEITSRVRALSRKCAPLRQAESLNEVVRDTLSLVRHELAHHKIRPNIDLAVFSELVSADRVQLQQVIINLIINACHAMDAVKVCERTLYIRTSVKDSEVVLEVVDQGSGIPTDVLPHLFTPFFTTKEHGLGLGLSICRSIIDFHGGRIWATSAAGKGSTFQFALPVLTNIESA